LGNRGYVGLGQDLKGHFFKDFWALDFGTKSWSSIADFPDQIDAPINIIMNGKSYLLTGFDPDDTPIPNFYEYDPQLDQWNRFGRLWPG